MASLAQAIQTFHKGDLSRNEFLAQIDRALALERSNWQRLREILSEENTRGMLPPDIYAELQRRVEHAPDPDAEVGETRLRTESAAALPAGQGGYMEVADPDRMKGIGDTINGRFVLEECLGFGGMGTVYKALDLRKLEASDRKPYIAIKVLNVQFRGHPKSLITLQREAKKAQALAHPNIVRVYDFDREGPVVYLTMEYLAGKPLSQVLRAPGFTGLPYPEALPIVTGMGRGLAYAHQQGFVHCDLKPANVFLTDKGEVKVIDFGIARAFHKPEDDAEATVFDPGSLGGLTPAYASPEMVEHREPDPRDDIYGLACITYEMVSGHHPFNRLSGAEARNAGMKPERPRQLGYRQWQALKSALCFDRARRTPSVEAFLQGFAADNPAARNAAVIAGVVALALLVGAGVGYYLEFRDGGASEQVATAGGAAPAVAEAPARPPAATGTAAPAPPVQPAAPAASQAAQPAAPQAAAPAPSQTAAPAPVLSLSAVEPVLAAQPCALLAPAVRGDTLQVQGLLPDAVGAARLRELLTAVPGVGKLDLQVAPLGQDKCGVVSVLAPYWLANRKAGTPATLRVKGASAQSAQPMQAAPLVEGDKLVLDLTTPAYDAYVTVDYFALDGSVLHMVPSPRARENRTPPSYSATIGGSGNWVIAKPFGTELIALIVTPAPLFDAMRPESEPKAGYLKALEQRLTGLGAEHGRQRIAVDVLQVTTRPRRP
jgi:hypothetical protein